MLAMTATQYPTKARLTVRLLGGGSDMCTCRCVRVCANEPDTQALVHEGSEHARERHGAISHRHGVTAWWPRHACITVHLVRIETTHTKCTFS